MTSLVLAEHDNKVLSPATACAVTAARQIGAPVHLLVAGEDCASVAEAAAKLAGVEKLLLAEDALYRHGLAEPVAALIAGLAAGYDSVLAPATAMGKSILPRLAALLDVPQISEIVRVIGPNIFERPIYAGGILETVEADKGKKIITVRVAAFAPSGGQPPAPRIKIPVGSDPYLSTWLNEAAPASGWPELSTARIVVAGGRGIATKEGFAHLEQLALGVSGAIQHVAGMRDAKLIAAINRDEEAPIFRIADVGLVADLGTALPEMARELDKFGL